MNTQGQTHKPPLVFFVLVFMLSIPFWILGALVEPQNIPINLPVSALATFTPLIAASILILRENGAEGVKRFWRRAFDLKRIEKGIWYATIFLLMPLIAVAEYVVMSLTGNPIPDPQFPILIAPAMFGVFFVGAVGEEMGWQGYTFEPLQARWDALGASVLLGVVWAVWHIVPFIQTHNSTAWIAWQCGTLVGLRVLTVWLYNNTGQSVFAVITFHAMCNVSMFMFPNYRSHYDPFITGILTLSVVGIAIYFWGAKTLAHYRYNPAHIRIEDESS